MTVKKHIHFDFAEELVQQPLLYQLNRKFDVVVNIRGASVSDDQALMAVELEGEDGEVERAVIWLKERGVTVEPLRPDQELKL